MLPPPLKQVSRIDTFDQPTISYDLAEFTFDYCYWGKRYGHRATGNIEMMVASWVIDHIDNVYLRFCTYRGHKAEWKERIEEQIRGLMRDIEIGEGFIKPQLRFFEVDKSKSLNAEKFEQNVLDLKSKMKNNVL